jgi:6-phosphogluconolactonase (cycloisomerase 2 family)
VAHETLHVAVGPATGNDLVVDRELLIGRNAAGAGRLGDDPELSRDHARVRRTDDGQLLIEDLGSTNGTRVNGARIAGPALLRAGDQVQAGSSVIEVRGEPVAAAPAALGPLPPIGRPAPERRGSATRRQAAVALLLVLLAGAVVAVLATRKDTSAKSATPADFDGTLYIESNDRRPSANGILAFRYRNGSLRPLDVREYPTGGSGSHDLQNHGVLDAEQQITTNADRTLLFAVNAGSDSVAVFRIAADGTLTPAKGSPFTSQGLAPGSVGVMDDELFVANKAQDGTRDLRKSPASYATFRIAKDGVLTPLGSPVEVPPRSSPTQTYVPPHTGRLMIATEEAGPFRAFTVDSQGTLHAGPNSPLKLEPRVFLPQKPRGNVWPQGLIAHPKLPLIYAGVANIRRLVVYQYDAPGRLSFVSSQVNKGTFLPCWTQINRAGTRLYTGNAGSQNISVFDIATDPRHPRQIQRVTLHGQGLPWNFQLDPTGRYLFIINMRAVSDIPPGLGNTLHSFAIGADGKLTELPSSPVPIPVPLNTNPWGMALVPRR